jgi:hypothetical protein
MASPADSSAANGTTDASASNAASSVSGGELQRLESKVASAPQDFDSWTALVSEAQKTADPVRIRDALNGLLAQFPLCYGYWQQLAKLEAEQSAAGVPAAEALKNSYAVFERGVAAIPHGHELWTTYVTEIMKNDQLTPEEVRRSVKHQTQHSNTRETRKKIRGGTEIR